jgi:hypothetical protein
MIYDVRTLHWSAAAIDFVADKVISAAKVDANSRIDAAFAHKKSNIVLIQKDKYFVIDITNQCTNATAVGVAYPANDITDLQIQSTVDAMTEKGDDTNLLLFQSPSYWMLEVKAYSSGKLSAVKYSQLDIRSEFFHYKTGDCLQTTTPVPTLVLSGTNNSDTEPVVPVQRGDNGLTVWIVIIVVIMVIIVLIVVGIIIFVSRKKGDDRVGDELSATGRSRLTTKTRPLTDSRAEVTLRSSDSLKPKRGKPKKRMKK